jgi:outer membrane lipoprotein-sorting protein
MNQRHVKVRRPGRSAVRVIAIVFGFLLFAPVPGRTATLSATDRADVARVESFLNDIRTLSATFLQVAPDGAIAEGRFLLMRPGRLRFEYAPPSPVLVVADGTYVNYFDRDLGQLSQVGVYDTPLGAVIGSEVNLSGRTAVATVSRGAGTLALTIVDAKEPERGTLTLEFADRPLELRRWLVKDAQGLVTVVALDHVAINPTLDRNLFVFEAPGAASGTLGR